MVGVSVNETDLYEYQTFPSLVFAKQITPDVAFGSRLVKR